MLGGPSSRTWLSWRRDEGGCAWLPWAFSHLSSEEAHCCPTATGGGRWEPWSPQVTLPKKAQDSTAAATAPGRGLQQLPRPQGGGSGKLPVWLTAALLGGLRKPACIRDTRPLATPRSHTLMQNQLLEPLDPRAWQTEGPRVGLAATSCHITRSRDRWGFCRAQGDRPSVRAVASLVPSVPPSPVASRPDTIIVMSYADK